MGAPLENMEGDAIDEFGRVIQGAQPSIEDAVDRLRELGIELPQPREPRQRVPAERYPDDRGPPPEEDGPNDDYGRF
jgi:penicillin-binding protein 1A